MTAIPVLFERKEPPIQFVPVDRIDSWFVRDGYLIASVGQHEAIVLYAEPSHPQGLDKMKFERAVEAQVDVLAAYVNPLIELFPPTDD